MAKSRWGTDTGGGERRTPDGQRFGYHMAQRALSLTDNKKAEVFEDRYVA